MTSSSPSPSLPSAPTSTSLTSVIHKDLPHSDRRRWNIIYPIYINSQKTFDQGRRLAIAKCVERPTLLDIAEIAHTLNIPYVVESDKCYSRDFTQRGRIKIQILNDSGVPINEKIKNKMSFLHYCGENINKLEKHKARVDAILKMEMKEQQELAAIAGGSGDGGGGGGGGGDKDENEGGGGSKKKKKGKK